MTLTDCFLFFETILIIWIIWIIYFHNVTITINKIKADNSKKQTKIK